VTNPLSEHLGDAFFRSLPRQAGVYFFYDEADRLLYIGQSNNLRARVGSYRHVNFERHARRTVRLVHRVRRIAWEVCESGELAIQRERELLLERRPPFNRAGVWRAAPWWLLQETREDGVRFWVKREETVSAEERIICFGPYGAGFPYVYAALIRAVLRFDRPDLPASGFPCGWLQQRRVAEALMRRDAADRVGAFLRGQANALLPEEIVEIPQQAPPSFERQLRDADTELLREFLARLG
jgi:excinuclease UvrABC nuclease subunit